MLEFTTAVIPNEMTNFTVADTTTVPVILDPIEESEYLPSVLFKEKIYEF